MPLFYDQMNRAVELPALPWRIISIVPSQTELLFYLGLNERVVGVTKFCIYPADKVQYVTTIGGTKQLNIEAIHGLKPDIIIANKEENEQTQVEELMQYYPVWISDINNLPTSLEMIYGIGEITGTQSEAQHIISKIEEGFIALRPAAVKLNVLYLIWRKPYMAAGTDTFINSMLQLCGFENTAMEARYPQLTADDIRALNPDVVLLSSEPYPFSEKHIDEFRKMLPDTKIELVDGELFSWYGSRLLESPKYFKKFINKLTAK